MYFVRLIFPGVLCCLIVLTTSNQQDVTARAALLTALPPSVDSGQSVCAMPDNGTVAIGFPHDRQGIPNFGTLETTAGIFFGGRRVPPGRYELSLDPGKIVWDLTLREAPLLDQGAEHQVARAHLLVTKLLDPVRQFAVRLQPFQDAGQSGCTRRFEW
jgi:hypothetical protein